MGMGNSFGRVRQEKRGGESDNNNKEEERKNAPNLISSLPPFLP
jgi:hypothetical protein